MAQQTNPKRPDSGRFLSILILVVVVLLVFEGRVLINLFSEKGIKKQLEAQLSEALEGTIEETEAPTEAPVQTEKQTEPMTEAPKKPAEPLSDAVVPEQPVPVDDSYFADAVFIGDSRVEGFKSQSGITTGTFLTGVGMNVTSIYDTPYITTSEGSVTVFDALTYQPYGKIYIMLGTNELGAYDFNEFESHYKAVLEQIQAIQPNAIIYVMGVIYVDESLVETSDYVNNANVNTVNEHILKICEEDNFHYINLNEVFDDGTDSLLPGAAIDGIHLYERYCVMWLDYLKNHYVSGDGTSAGTPSGSSASGTQSESGPSDPGTQSGNSQTESSTETESSAETGPYDDSW